MTSVSLTPRMPAVRSNGYRFTQTRSTYSMSCSAAASTWPGSSRTASRPAYSRGCSVLTRPSMISGKPVKSSTLRTSTPAPDSSRSVPPVETTSTPSSARPRAKSTIPRLSETDNSARRTRTAPGWVSDGSGPVEVGSAMPARIDTLPAGKPFDMERPDTDAEHSAARTEEQLSERLDDLGEDIEEAKRTVHENMADADQP